MRGLVDALAYALARADLPDDVETSRQYAERLASLVVESGYIAAYEAAVEALEGMLAWPYRPGAIEAARAALARLRETVPSA